jgi:hypothetical protein
MVVSKIIPAQKRSAGIWSRIERLVRYVLGLDLDRPEEKCLASFVVGFIGQAPEHWIYEMQIAASAALRSQDPNYHQVLSWSFDEALMPSDLEKIVLDYIDFYNLSGHQIVSGLHQNTENFHIHLFVCRFNVQTGRVVQINRGFTRHHGARFCAFLESTYGYIPSDNASAYSLRRELVLSDFYNTHSASGYIKNKEVAFGTKSTGRNIAQAVQEILPRVASWHEFQDALLGHGISLSSGKRGGLVYGLLGGPQDGIHVAASRVSPSSRRSVLAMRFEADFDEDYIPKQIEHGFPLANPTIHDKRSSPDAVSMEANLTGKYRRRSQPQKGPDFEFPARGLEVAVSQLGALFAGSHLLFRYGRMNSGAPFYLMDRKRGDPSALTLQELLPLMPNIVFVAQDGAEVLYKPACDDEVAGQCAVALIGPHTILESLHGRALFPGIVQTLDAGQSYFLFLGVAADDSLGLAALRAAAAELGCQVDDEPRLILARNKTVFLPTISPLLSHPPELLNRLIPPRDRQFGFKFDQIRSRLAASLEVLTQFGRVRLQKLMQAHRLKSALMDVYRSGGPSPPALDGDVNDAESDSRELGPRSTKPGEIASGPGMYSRSALAAPGRGEEQRIPAPDVRGTERVHRRPEVANIEPHVTSGKAAVRGEVDAGGAGSPSKGSDRADHGERLAPSPAGKPGGAIPFTESSLPAPKQQRGPMTPQARMLRCLLVAARYSVEARWHSEGADILIFAKAARRPEVDQRETASEKIVAHVMATGIRAQSDAPPALLRDLSDNLSLAVSFPSPSPSGYADPAAAVRQGAVVTTKRSEGRTVEGAPDDCQQRERPPAPSVDQDLTYLIFDPFNLCVDDNLEDRYVRVTSKKALLAVNLVRVEDVLYAVDNKLDPKIAALISEVKAALVESGMPPSTSVQAWMPDEVRQFAPKTLILEFDPDGALNRDLDPSDEHALVLPVKAGQLPDWSGIEVAELSSIVIDLPKLEPGAAAEMNNLLKRLEESFAFLSLTKEPKFFSSLDEYQDARRENETYFGM